MTKIKDLPKNNRFKIFEGSSKDIFQLYEEDSTLTLFFKDELRHQDKQINISGKGVLNNTISSFVMQKTDMVGIPNHLIEKSNMREQIVQILDIIPIQVRISNLAVDNYVTQFGVQEGYIFDSPMIEFRAKNKETGNPVINESQMIGFNWVSKEEIDEMKILAKRINDFLSGFFAGCSLRLVESYMEFGRVFNGEDFILMLADEITPESCALWDLNSNDKFDINAISESDKPIEIYKEIAKRIKVSSKF